MSRHCPSNTSLIGDLCYYDCPFNYEPDNQDHSECVMIGDPPVGWTKAPNSNSVIVKPSPVPKDTLPNNTCPVTYVEWVYGMCYLQCPTINYLDAGFTCIKIPQTRAFINPSCPTLYYFNNNGDCALSTLGSTIFLILIGALLLMLYHISRMSMLYVPFIMIVFLTVLLVRG
jgi:hypothetical protein